MYMVFPFLYYGPLVYPACQYLFLFLFCLTVDTHTLRTYESKHFSHNFYVINLLLSNLLT
jgi:hypothetical protein